MFIFRLYIFYYPKYVSHIDTQLEAEIVLSKTHFEFRCRYGYFVEDSLNIIKAAEQRPKCPPSPLPLQPQPSSLLSLPTALSVMPNPRGRAEPNSQRTLSDLPPQTRAGDMHLFVHVSIPRHQAKFIRNSCIDAQGILLVFKENEANYVCGSLIHLRVQS